MKFQEVRFHASNIELESRLMQGNLLFTAAKFAAKKRMNSKIIKDHYNSICKVIYIGIYKGIYKGITIGGVQSQNRKVKVRF